MVRVNLIKPKRLQAVDFSRADLLKIGAKTIEVIQKRCARGMNVRDKASKPLSPKYKAKKEAIGQPGVRNEMFSGSMLGALTIVQADQNKVVVGFTRQAELAKAAKNQQRDRWFGISKNYEGVILSYAERLLRRRAGP